MRARRCLCDTAAAALRGGACCRRFAQGPLEPASTLPKVHRPADLSDSRRDFGASGAAASMRKRCRGGSRRGSGCRMPAPRLVAGPPHRWDLDDRSAVAAVPAAAGHAAPSPDGSARIVRLGGVASWQSGGCAEAAVGARLGLGPHRGHACDERSHHHGVIAAPAAGADVAGGAQAIRMGRGAGGEAGAAADPGAAGR
mmetsp:Transcript_116064/g.322701  ORF Transcript_116064/g.322701 Transcript_116064/m.322701 type:complete len:198 (-) Transcript_116064:339-932(-)